MATHVVTSKAGTERIRIAGDRRSYGAGDVLEVDPDKHPVWAAIHTWIKAGRIVTVEVHRAQEAARLRAQLEALDATPAPVKPRAQR